MGTGTVFLSNGAQAVRLPADTRFPEHVKQVHVRVVGQQRVLAPVESTWDRFFLPDQRLGDDFLPERASQRQAKRHLVV